MEWCGAAATGTVTAMYICALADGLVLVVKCGVVVAVAVVVVECMVVMAHVTWCGGGVGVDRAN